MAENQRDRSERNQNERMNEQEPLRDSRSNEQRTSSDRDLSREQQRQESSSGSGRSYDYDSTTERDQKIGTESTGHQVPGGSRGESKNAGASSGLKTKSSVTGSDTDGQL